jgi:hypothetical protein
MQAAKTLFHEKYIIKEPFICIKVGNTRASLRKRGARRDWNHNPLIGRKMVFVRVNLPSPL